MLVIKQINVPGVTVKRQTLISERPGKSCVAIVALSGSMSGAYIILPSLTLLRLTARKTLTLATFLIKQRTSKVKF